jgi:catechol 2,3-dioxygenase-like lactoylglutathione lyase family enzyme
MFAIHHLALRTRDVSGLARFYAEWFGLRVVADHAPRSLWLALGETAVLMVEAAQPGEPCIPASSLELMAFRVSPEQRSSLRAKLVAAGQLEGETAHTLYFRDPDGRRVGVSSHPLDLGHGSHVPSPLGER